MFDNIVLDIIYIKSKSIGWWMVCIGKDVWHNVMKFKPVLVCHKTEKSLILIQVLYRS